MACSYKVPGTFTANNCTWVVTSDLQFIILHTDLETGKYYGHIGPITQWLPVIQEAARAHHKAHTLDCAVI